MKIFTPIILIVVSIGLFFVIIDPKFDETKVLNEKIDSNKQLITRALLLRSKQDELTKQYKQISEDERATMNKFLPDAVDNVRLILDINNIAEKIDLSATDSGINITNIGAQGDNGQTSGTTGRQTSGQITASATTYGTIQLTFSATAGYDSFKKFMHELENSLRLVDIVSFEVKPGLVVDGKETYNYLVTLNTYWLK